MKDATNRPQRGTAVGARLSALALVWATAVVVGYLAVRELGLTWTP